jgi:S-formylglutathione hydrolase FrmB
MQKTFFLISLIVSLQVCAQTTDTVRIYSSAMKKNISCVVIMPAGYDNKKRFPVVYLLHGYDGKYDNWIKKMPALKDWSTLFHSIIVCPDGGNSWYFNSTADSSIQYETFITNEVVSFTDKKYKTIADKAHRAITGLSMGGHGAIFLAIRHPRLFGAAGSISGAVDIGQLKNKYNIIQVLGDTIRQAAAWQGHSVINLFDSIPFSSQPLIIDCGSDDPFIGSNRLLHEKLMKLKIPHDYIERNGGHDWRYWTNALPYQLLFFRKFFDAGSEEL